MTFAFRKSEAIVRRKLQELREISGQDEGATALDEKKPSLEQSETLIDDESYESDSLGIDTSDFE